MIELPRRSVTRFFIPLIDVLTLLFCIFLMMPAVKKVTDAEAAEAVSPAVREQQLKKREQAVDDRERQLRQEADRVRRETTQQVLKDLRPRILEIDPSNGKLYYRDSRTPTKPVEIAGEADARALIRRDQAGPGGPDAVYYIIRYPLDPNSDYPRQGDPEKFEEWFAGVPLEFERAGARVDVPKKGGQP